MTKNSSNSSGKSGNTKQISPALWWCFTWNNYEKSDISSILKSNLIDKYIFQEEIGENGTPHLQGTIKFYRKQRPKTHFDNRIHWEKCKHIQKSIDYCCKSDTRVGKVYTNIEMKEPIETLTDLSEWQTKLRDRLIGKPNPRSIYWIWDSKGNTGKSSFAKYLCVNHDALILSGKGNDMKFGVIEYMKKHVNGPKIIIIDIPRSNLDYVSYTGIEEIKNGCFFSSKYEGSMCVFNNPHIICFANELPNTSKMSSDRWKIMEIS